MENAAAYTKTARSQRARCRCFTSTDCLVGLYPHYMSVCGGSLFFKTILQREPLANIKSRTVRAMMKRNDFKQLTNVAPITSQLVGCVTKVVRAIGMITRCFLIGCSRYVSSRARVWVVSDDLETEGCCKDVSSRARVWVVRCHPTKCYGTNGQFHLVRGCGL